MVKYISDVTQNEQLEVRMASDRQFLQKDAFAGACQQSKMIKKDNK
tara:strand:+ start:232 stop:369 length:138 start_codon:yes stop_codon:yes gene_type:complete